MDDILLSADLDGSTRTSSRTSVPSARVEIVTSSGRRRWSLEQKRDIVAESLGPELTPTEVARKHAISSGQLYTWRRERLGVQTAMMTRSAPRFAEVVSHVPSQPLDVDPAPAEISPPSSPAASARPDGLIEIVLPSGVVVRLDGHVDAGALRRVLGALDGR